jgi:membrane dipeptidase
MPVIDLHIDLADLAHYYEFTINDIISDKPNTPVTIAKLRRSEIALSGFTLYCDQSFVTDSYYAAVKKFCAFYQSLAAAADCLIQVKSSSDLVKLDQGKLAYLYTMEGFDCLREPDDFDEFYDLGARCFGFTWNHDNRYACGQLTKNDTGISSEGYEVLRRMKHREKLLLDVSHLSKNGMKDLGRGFDGMIVATHCNVNALCPHPHNITDDQIQMVVDHGGVIGLFPYGPCVGPECSFEELYRHLEYVASHWDIKYAAFSSDIYPMPGHPFVAGYTDILVWEGLKDFLSTKLTPAQVQQVCFDNWYRVLHAAL